MFPEGSLRDAHTPSIRNFEARRHYASRVTRAPAETPGLHSVLRAPSVCRYRSLHSSPFRPA